MIRVSFRECCLLGLLLIAAIPAACGGQRESGISDAGAAQVIPSGGAADGLVVTFSTDPNPPAKGDNTVQVTVKQADGSPVTDGTVKTVYHRCPRCRP